MLNKLQQTAVGQQSWPPARHAHTNTHMWQMSPRRLCVLDRARSGVRGSCAAAYLCGYQMFDHRSFKGDGGVLEDCKHTWIPQRGLFSGMTFHSFLLCHSAMWRESNPANWDYSVTRIPRALPEQPELRLEDHRTWGNGNSGAVYDSNNKPSSIYFTAGVGIQSFTKRVSFLGCRFTYSSI